MTSSDGNATPMADIHDIKPVIVTKGLPWAAIWIGVAALLLLILLLLGRYLWKKHSKGGEIPTLTPELPPEENARLALSALAAGGLGDGRRFYFRLSEILRRYLFERYGIGAPEMTPEELQPLVARLKLPNGQLGVLNRFWSNSEPVKFAGRPAREADMAADLDRIGRFVEVTTDALNRSNPSDSPQDVVAEASPAPSHRSA